MTLEEYYASINGDLAGVRGRLMADDKIIKFLKFFLMDPSYGELCTALESDDMESAFRAAHTMKGTSSNLGFGDLLASSTALADALRPDASGQPSNPAAVPELKAKVDADYALVVEGAKQF